MAGSKSTKPFEEGRNLRYDRNVETCTKGRGKSRGSEDEFQLNQRARRSSDTNQREELRRNFTRRAASARKNSDPKRRDESIKHRENKRESSGSKTRDRTDRDDRRKSRNYKSGSRKPSAEQKSSKNGHRNSSSPRRDEHDGRTSEGVIYRGKENIEENAESFNPEENNTGAPEISQRHNEPEELNQAEFNQIPYTSGPRNSEYSVILPPRPPPIPFIRVPPIPFGLYYYNPYLQTFLPLPPGNPGWPRRFPPPGGMY